MNNSEIHKKIDELIEELFRANETAPIIVEGKNDEFALRKLGMAGKIFRLNTGLSILNFCEKIARKYGEVIILTDWDEKGKQLFDKLKEHFIYTNVKIIDKFWFEFKKYCSKEIHEVEYLTKFLND